jgi:hypothetical protein
MTDKLKTLLQTPIPLRSIEISREVAEIVKGVKFLSQYKHKPEFIEICKNLYVKTFEKR